MNESKGGCLDNSHLSLIKHPEQPPVLLWDKSLYNSRIHDLRQHTEVNLNWATPEKKPMKPFPSPCVPAPAAPHTGQWAGEAIPQTETTLRGSLPLGSWTVWFVCLFSPSSWRRCVTGWQTHHILSVPLYLGSVLLNEADSCSITDLGYSVLAQDRRRRLPLGPRVDPELRIQDYN